MVGNIFLALALSFSSVAAPKVSPWLERQAPFALEKILFHSAQPGAPEGSVIASPSRENPDYYFHWVRDAALVMDPLVSLYIDGKRELLPRLLAYAEFSRANQKARALTGLGEPKFHVDGTPFDGPWGRPQNDGPALRAVTLTRLAEKLLAEGKRSLVIEKFYDGSNHSPIKTDLEYISHYWREASFDLWEEVLGDHFYTRMVQRRALRLGARLARKLGDPGAADWYEKQSLEIERSLEKFWDPKLGYVKATLHHRGGLDYKTQNLDVAVILGALHGGMGDGFFDVNDLRVQKTLTRLLEEFSALYPINRQRGTPGIAIGRYPEDKYAGSDFNGGNPWVLATLAVAEMYYRLGLAAMGDEFVARVIFHANGDGSLAEQMQRNTGYMCSAENLTWNYAAILTTARARSAR